MKLFQWSQDWQMLFNIEKCKMLRVGRKNKEEKCSMGGICLDSIEEEKGVIVNKTFKVSSQCATAENFFYQVLGMITRTFTCRNKVLMMKLYKTLVRPHLEYSIQAWRPHLQKDIYTFLKKFSEDLLG